MTTKAELRLTAVDDTKRAIDAAKGNLLGLDRAASQISGRFKALAGTLTAGFLANLVLSTAEAGDRLGDLSRQLDVSASFLSGFRLLAAQNGSSVEDFGTSLAFAQRKISEAANGNRDSIALFAELGLRAKQLKGLAPEQQFVIIAEAFKRLKAAGADQGDLLRIGRGVLGRDMGALQVALEGGVAAQKAFADAQRTGVQRSDAQIAALGGLADASAAAKLAVGGLLERLVAASAPNMIKDLERLSETVGKIAQPGSNAGRPGFLTPGDPGIVGRVLRGEIATDLSPNKGRLREMEGLAQQSRDRRARGAFRPDDLLISPAKNILANFADGITREALNRFKAGARPSFVDFIDPGLAQQQAQANAAKEAREAQKVQFARALTLTGLTQDFFNQIPRDNIAVTRGEGAQFRSTRFAESFTSERVSQRKAQSVKDAQLEQTNKILDEIRLGLRIRQVAVLR